VLGCIDDYSNDYDGAGFSHYFFELPVPADTVGW